MSSRNRSRRGRNAEVNVSQVLPEQVVYFSRDTYSNFQACFNGLLNQDTYELLKQIVNSIATLGVTASDDADVLRVNLVHYQIIDRYLITSTEQLVFFCRFLMQKNAPLIWGFVPDYLDRISCLNLIYDMGRYYTLTPEERTYLLIKLRDLGNQVRHTPQNVTQVTYETFVNGSRANDVEFQ